MPPQQGLHLAGVAPGPAGCSRTERRLGRRQCRPLDDLSADQRRPVSRLSRHVFDPDSATARCHFSKDDIRFLVETLPQLPCDEETKSPVTIDLNGQIAIRAKAADKDKPTEVVLTNSQWTGEPIRITINRTYLQRAMKLGLETYPSTAWTRLVWRGQRAAVRVDAPGCWRSH